MRPRFSLRTLLILTAIAAFALVWCLRPTLLAQRFIRTMNAGNYAAADRLIVRPAETIEWQIKKNQKLKSGGIHSCELKFPTLTDLIRGQRVVHVSIGAYYLNDGEPPPFEIVNGMPIYLVNPLPPSGSDEFDIVATISGHLRCKKN